MDAVSFWWSVCRGCGVLGDGGAGGLLVGDGLAVGAGGEQRGGGEGNRDRGQTVAIDPRTGRVVWRSEAFASQTGTPSFQDGRVYLPGTYRRPMHCLAADTGSRPRGTEKSEEQSDEDQDEVTRAKERFGKDHFQNVNNRLRLINPIDLTVDFQSNATQYYTFDFLRPDEYSGWFS